MELDQLWEEVRFQSIATITVMTKITGRAARPHQKHVVNIVQNNAVVIVSIIFINSYLRELLDGIKLIISSHQLA